MPTLVMDQVQTAIGELLLISDGEKLCGLDFVDFASRLTQSLKKRYGPVPLQPQKNPQGFSDRLCAYFAGDFAALDAIPVHTGGTLFQQQVWQALRQIPPGQIRTYGQLAAMVGRPTAQRAIGMINGLNPVAIVLPCHRVIGASGKLTGYAGGLERKRWLLQHEGVKV